MEKLWKFLNSQFGLIILGFICTGFVGHLLTVSFQNSAWERDRRYEVFKQEIEEAKKVLEDVNLHISSRTYQLQKVHWKLESGDITGANVEYEEYTKIKDSWNKKIRIYRNKLKRLVSNDLAFKLLDSDNAVNVPKKESVHAYFAFAHYATRKWMKCLNNSCPDAQKDQQKAYNALHDLFRVTDTYIDESYSIFLQKYKILNDSSETSR